MGMLKIVSTILSALSSVLTAAKAVVSFIKCMNELMPQTA